MDVSRLLDFGPQLAIFAALPTKEGRLLDTDGLRTIPADSAQFCCVARRLRVTMRRISQNA